jgi:uncharacterized protein (DUF1697 family)
VETFLASGNVVFDSPATDGASLERRIEDHLERALGYAVPTLVWSLPALARLADARPPDGEEGVAAGDSLYVVFLPAPADDEMRSRFAALESESDRFRFRERAAYWLIRDKLSDSPLFGPGLAKAVGSVRHTVRNFNTVERLVQRYGSTRDARTAAARGSGKSKGTRKR